MTGNWRITFDPRVEEPAPVAREPVLNAGIEADRTFGRTPTPRAAQASLTILPLRKCNSFLPCVEFCVLLLFSPILAMETPVFASLDAPLSAAPAPQPADPRAARLAKFKREQRIVEYLNRGVAVAEIAAQVGLSEKRMRAVIGEILDRRMPHPPAEFVAIQVSRLNEALLVAYSAMSMTNLKAVDQVVKIVRELDRYHGLSAGAGRRRFEPDALAAPDERTAAYGGAFVCRAEWAAADDEDLALAVADERPENPLQSIEKIDSAPGDSLSLPGLLTRGSRGEGWGEGLGRLAAESHPAPPPGLDPGASLLPVNGEKGRADASAGDGRPENPPEAIEKIESTPGEIETSPTAQDPLALPGLLTRGSREEGRGEGPGRLAAVDSHPAPHPNLLPARGEKGRSPAPEDRPEFSRPEFSLQAPEKIDSAPGIGERSDAAAAAPAEFPVIRMPILTSTGLKFVNARRTPNGMVAC